MTVIATGGDGAGQNNNGAARSRGAGRSRPVRRAASWSTGPAGPGPPGAITAYFILDPGSAITSAGGAVFASGTGGSGDGGHNHGIYVLTGGQITSAGSDASVTVTGIGGSGTIGNSYGVNIEDGGQVTSSGGDVTVIATGGTGARRRQPRDRREPRKRGVGRRVWGGRNQRDRRERLRRLFDRRVGGRDDHLQRGRCGDHGRRRDRRRRELRGVRDRGDDHVRRSGGRHRQRRRWDVGRSLEKRRVRPPRRFVQRGSGFGLNNGVGLCNGGTITSGGAGAVTVNGTAGTGGIGGQRRRSTAPTERSRPAGGR